MSLDCTVCGAGNPACIPAFSGMNRLESGPQPELAAPHRTYAGWSGNRAGSSGRSRPVWISAPKSLCAMRAGLFLHLLHGGHPLLHLPREMRHDSQHPFHHHQLAAVMHLVLLGGEQHLEAGFRGLL